MSREGYLACVRHSATVSEYSPAKMRQNTRTQTKPPKRLEEEALLKLQEKIDGRLSRYAQLQYALFLAKNYFAALEKNPIPREALIPSHFWFGDAVKLALHWRLYMLPQRDYQVFGVADSTMGRIISWSRELVSKPVIGLLMLNINII